MLVLFYVSCNTAYTPKPYGHLRLEIPNSDSLQSFDLPDYPYSFSFPSYGVITPSKDWYKEPYWVNINMPPQKAIIHISYKPVGQSLTKLTEDAYKLTYQHTYKAEAITEQPFVNSKDKVYGMLYLLEGNVASAAQFYVTDSVNHFLRGALYFNVPMNRDSLQPLIEKFTDDIRGLIGSIHFRKTKH